LRIERNDFWLRKYRSWNIERCWYGRKWIILDFAARKSLQIIDIKKKRQHLQKSQPWYDSECQNLKQRLKHCISKQKHENRALNENTRINYHFINKEYKRLLRQKKTNSSE
jgi:hypothetical protein